jgi:hypothetical protein
MATNLNRARKAGQSELTLWDLLLVLAYGFFAGIAFCKGLFF